MSAKVLYIEDLEKLEERIIMTLCRLEKIFPPGFFTVMVHLVLHLATEAKIGGPVAYRSMWFLERYDLKNVTAIFPYYCSTTFVNNFCVIFPFLFLHVPLCPEVICA